MNRIGITLFFMSSFLFAYDGTSILGLWTAVMLFILLIGLALWAKMKGKTDTIDDIKSFSDEVTINNDKINDRQQYNKLDDLFDETPDLQKKKTLKNILSDLYWKIYFPKWENK